ncbi:hypothetical protein GCM10010193_27760 [Kitasatospora atroaurantiaca]
MRRGPDGGRGAGCPYAGGWGGGCGAGLLGGGVPVGPSCIGRLLILTWGARHVGEMQSWGFLESSSAPPVVAEDELPKPATRTWSLRSVAVSR